MIRWCPPCLLLVLAFSGKCKLVLRFSVRDLVDTEPLIRSPKKTGKMLLDILDIVQLRSQWVIDINDDDLPVGLLLIKQCHNTEDLDLLDLPWGSNQLANLADVKWVIVTLCLGLWVNNVGVFPCLYRYSLMR